MAVQVLSKSRPPAQDSSPSSPGPYLHYNAQHVILSIAQKILEDASFEFAQKYLPSVLETAGFDCPAAVELSKWTKILEKHGFEHPAGTLGLDKASLPGLLTSARRLRNTAVHRISIPASEVCSLLRSAVALADTLHDHDRGSLLRRIYFMLSDRVEIMEFERAVRSEKASAELEGIRRAREALDRKEREITGRMLKEETDNKRVIGQLLEQAVEKTIVE